jgi:hypothetical protein
MKIMRENEGYNPFGRAGGGAPNRQSFDAGPSVAGPAVDWRVVNNNNRTEDFMLSEQ